MTNHMTTEKSDKMHFYWYYHKHNIPIEVKVSNMTLYIKYKDDWGYKKSEKIYYIEATDRFNKTYKFCTDSLEAIKKGYEFSFYDEDNKKIHTVLQPHYDYNIVDNFSVDLSKRTLNDI